MSRRARVLSLVVLVLWFAAACSSGGSTTPADSWDDQGHGGDATADGWDAATDGVSGGDMKDEDKTQEELPDFSGGEGVSDLDINLDDTLVEGGFRWPCTANEQCDSNYCVPFQEGYVCTKVCQEECPEGWDCKAALNSFPDIVFVCVPETNRLCKPCTIALDCAAQGDMCLTIGEGSGAGSYCTSDCSVKGTCPEGYTCTEIVDQGSGEVTGKQCLPDNGSCVCLPGVDGTTRPCQVENSFGACLGTETCQGALGWIGCTAKTPAAESCDDADDNCDGQIDEGFDFSDWDGSLRKKGESCGVGICEGGTVVCQSATASTCSSSVQKKDETCNGADDDCDGEVDEEVKTPFYLDVDKDGFGDAQQVVWACQAPEGYVAVSTDCDDQEAKAYPGLAESCDGIDNNCDGSTDEGFLFQHPDGTSVALGQPCSVGLCTSGLVVCSQDGLSAFCSAVNQAVPEVCDDLDQDCDGTADNGCDDDADGYCDAELTIDGVVAAVCPNGNGDCDDQNQDVNPGMQELCNLIDDDCSEVVDDLVVDCGPMKCSGAGNAYFETAAELCQTGECVPPDPVGCGLYTCALGGALGTECAASCIDDSTCVASAHCDEASIACVDDFNNGHVCLEASDCKSGHCQNGFCCEGGDCCAQPVDCPLLYSAAAVCDSTATCQGSRIDAQCVSNTCQPSAPIADDTACSTDTLAQECAPYPDLYCSGAPSQVAPLCSATCANDAQCDAGFHCDGTCQPNLGDGLSCDEASDCAGGHCQNGFCCASGDCCSTVDDCPGMYSRAASCDVVATCQGTRQDAQCLQNRCVKSANLADDSACLSDQLARTCIPYQPLYCSGATEQAAPVCPTSCTSDGDCVAGYHCDGTCVANLSAGGPCDENSDCQSSYCNNGFCCSGGTCCSQPGDCPSAVFAVAAQCDDTSSCQGTRMDATCTASQCGTSAPIPDDSACTSSVLALDCTPYLDKYCTGAANQTAPVCASGCTGDGQCEEGYHCDGTCKPDVANGGICDETSDCVSNHCQNGFCCGAGDCCQVAADCPSTYLLLPSCDSPATCQGTRKDRVCQSNQCGTSSAIDDDSACLSSTLALTCTPYLPKYCSGAVSQSAPACATSCTADAQCEAGYHCDGTCKADLVNGQVCDEASDCVAKHCQNGYCCGFGDCCANAANCSTALYSEVATCTTVASCQGSRKDPACVNSECRKSDAIDDDSGCTSSMVSDECGLFGSVYCSGAAIQTDPACATSCSSDAQCDATAHCEGGSCVADKPLGGTCSAASWCASGFCVDGVCCSTSCTGLCAACNLAGSVGTCSNIPSGGDPANECASFTCSSYYWGFNGSSCLLRADSPLAGTCTGAGTCYAAATLCPAQASGSTYLTCNSTCQTPTSGTCTGTTAGTCTNINPGTVSCGVGECARTVDQCTNGAPNTCVEGTPTTEICDNKDQNCDGTVDNLITSAYDSYEANETCAAPYSLGDLAELSSDTQIASATIYYTGDKDYYKINALEGAHTCFPFTSQTYKITVRLIPPTGDDCRDYDVYLYDSACGSLSSSTLGGCTTDSFTYTWSGTCTINDDRTFIIGVTPFSGAWECKPYQLWADMFSA